MRPGVISDEKAHMSQRITLTKCFTMIKFTKNVYDLFHTEIINLQATLPV